MQKPTPTTYLAYFEKYVNLVPEQDLFEAFANQFPILKSFLAAVPSNKQEYAYADSKWTMKEMLLHMIDTERIFSYRALCIARGEQGCLLGFNENRYAENSNANSRSWQSLVDEFLIHIFSISWFKEGLMNLSRGVEIYKIGLWSQIFDKYYENYILLGHFYHHKKVAEEKYL